MKTFWLIIGLMFVSVTGNAQEPSVPADAPPFDSLSADTLHIDTTGAPMPENDTIIFVPPIFPGERSVTDTVNLETRLRQRPTTALLKSLVIPGWGQVGNGRPLKAGIYAGLQGWFIGAAFHYGGQASDLKNLYEASTVDEQRNDYYHLYEDRRQERNKYIFFLGLTTLVSVFDAYVDAHLSGTPADQEKQFGLHVGPTMHGAQALLTLRF
jgi:hypothetical protein